MLDISATGGNGSTMAGDRWKLALRGLLAERFGLKVHWETRESSGFSLTIARGAGRPS
jgi:uncharacterized protein (TIGR03435 family)